MRRNTSRVEIIITVSIIVIIIIIVSKGCCSIETGSSKHKLTGPKLTVTSNDNKMGPVNHAKMLGVSMSCFLDTILVKQES